jgi:hypothetical protein
MVTTQAYKQELHDRYWRYHAAFFGGQQDILDPRHLSPSSPPVFAKEFAYLNVLSDPQPCPGQWARLMDLVPAGERHRWFGRAERCPLTAKGILYWKYVPQLFMWHASDDHRPCCPLNQNYQLVRNILAACVRTDGTAAPDKGHAVLLYDERNPAFGPGGDGLSAFDDTRQGLRNPGLLRKCS